MFICKEVETIRDKKLFVKLPKRLYPFKSRVNNITLEKEILNKVNVFSNDFEIYPYIVLNTDDIVCSRAILFIYPNEQKGYIGFFESIDNEFAFKCLMDTIVRKAKELNISKLEGPMNGSMWLGYRFKVDNFDSYYTGEPYNLNYYSKLWKDYGFEIIDKYASNRLGVPNNDLNYSKILNRYIQKGYEVINPIKTDFIERLKDVYKLMIDVYSNFKGFRKITEEQFLQNFKYLKNVLNYDMVFLVYKNKELVGFSVAVPNYSFLKYNILKFNEIKKNAKEFVILYIGCNKKCIGLGAALAELNKIYLQEHNCKSISALIHEGNTPEKYYSNLIESINHYEYYEYEIKN